MQDEIGRNDRAGSEQRRRSLSSVAKRALDEAEQRRRQRSLANPPSVERGGQPGPEPTRYGDWEKGGIVSDF